MSKLLIALGYTDEIIAQFPNDILTAAKVIEGFQDMYVKIENESHKESLAVLITKSVTGLLKLIRSRNLVSDITIGLPSTDPRTWDFEYEIGDVVRVRKDFAQSSYADANSELIIDKIEIVDGFKRPENPSGKLYGFSNSTSQWEGKDLELVRAAIPTTTTTEIPTTSTTTAMPRPTTTAMPRPTTTAIPRPTTTAIPRPTTTAIPRPTTTAMPRPTTTAMPQPNTATPTTTTTTTTTKMPYKTKRQVENAIRGVQFLASIGDVESISILRDLQNLLKTFDK